METGPRVEGAHKTGTSYDTGEAPSVGYLENVHTSTGEMDDTHREHTFRIPRAQDNPTIRWILLDLLDTLAQLIDTLPGIILVAIDVLGPKMPPLEAIHGAKVAFPPVAEPVAVEECARAVAVPDLDAALGEQGGVRFPVDKPEKLFDYASVEGAFGSEEGEGGVGEREAEGGRGENGQGSGAGAVRADGTCIEDASDEVKVLLFLVD